MKNIAFIITFLFVLSSCEEKIPYKWSEINDSLGELDKARKELKSEISNLEDEGYDCSELESIDNRLKKAEKILDSRFY